MTTATPTPEGDSRLYGVPVTRVEYPSGLGGTRLSLTEISRRIVEGSRAPSMRAFAEMVIRQWGRIPANQQLSNQRAAQIFLDFVRSFVRYRPDPPNTEYTQSAAITLCVQGAPMCVPVEDCDGLVTALATLCAAYGIPAGVLKQFYSDSEQEHVLVVIQDDTGTWLPADPSVPDKPVGWKAPAAKEDFIDPNDPTTISRLRLPDAEFIGVGRVGRMRLARRPQSLGALVRRGLGAGFVLPGDVLAYRDIWDDYVMGTARMAAMCATAWAAQAAGQTPLTRIPLSNFATPPDAQTLTLWAQSEKQLSDDIVSAWNAHANLKDWEIVSLAEQILQDFQSVVRRVGDFYQPQIAHDCPGLELPVPPGIELQKQVIARIEGLGILAHGVLQLLGIGASGALQTYEAIAQTAADAAKSASTFGIGGFLLGVAAAFGGIYVASRYLPPPHQVMRRTT